MTFERAESVTCESRVSAVAALSPWASIIKGYCETLVLNTVYLVSIMHHACNEREDILYSCTAWKVGNVMRPSCMTCSCVLVSVCRNSYLE